MAPKYMRSRSRGGDYNSYFRDFSVSHGIGGPYPVGTVTSTVETLFDSTTRKGKDGLYRNVTDCFHDKWTLNVHQYEPFYGTSGELIVPLDCPGYFGSLADLSALVPVIPDSLRSQLCEEAFNTFSDQFPEKISFAEFILGLQKLQDLLPKLERSLQKTFAGGFLTWKFGWENLLSDLRGFSNLIDSLQSRLDFLRKTLRKPTRLGYYKGNCFSPSVIGDYSYNEPYYGWGSKVVLTGYRCDFRSGGTLYQDLKHLDDLFGYFRALVGALGLNNPVKAIWVNLPFSFVADWFLGISKHLDRLTRVNAGEEWRVYNTNHSFKVHCTFKVFQVNDAVGPIANSGYVLGNITLDRFDRRVGLPIGWDVLTPTNLNPNQLALLFAMLA